MSHEDIQSLLGAYALDAVDPDERVLVEDHLRECPRCRDEVASFQEVASQLAYAGSTAPPGLWAKVASSLTASSAPIELLPRQARSRWRHPQVWISAAAAVLVVAFGTLGWEVHQDNRKVASLSAAVLPSRLQREMTQLSLDPTSSVAALSSADHKVVLNVVLGADGAGFLASDGTLPTLNRDQTYQLWGIAPGQTVSLGLLGSKPAVVAFSSAGSDLSGMAVTAEPEGGTAQPTTQPVAFGTLHQSRA